MRAGRLRAFASSIAVSTKSTAAAMAIAVFAVGFAPNRAAAADLAKVTVAVLPALDAMPIYVAQAKGYFAKAGIEADIQRFQGGPAVLQSVLAGGAQFAIAGTVPFINATARKAELLAIGVDAFFNARTQTMGIFVKKNSGIRTIKDLRGRTVGINQRGNMESMIITTRMLPKEGLSPSAFKIVELPYPLMQKSLDAGRVDAVISFQPFTELMSQDPNLSRIGYLDSYIADPGYAITFAIVDSGYAGQHPDVVKGYISALNEALAFARQSPEEAAAIVAKAFKLPATVIAPALQSIEFAGNEAQVEPATWNGIVEVMKQVGAIPASYQIESYIRLAR